MPNTTRFRIGASISFLLVALATLGLNAEETVTERRTHYVIVSADGVQSGQATRLVRFASTWSSSHTLFEGSTGDSLVLEDRIDFAAKTTEWTIRNVKGDAWITARVTLPFSGKTAAEAEAEFRDTKAQVFKLMRDDLEFETNAGSWKGSEAGWAGDARLEFTKQLRLGTSFDLLESIERSADSAFVNFVEVDSDITLAGPLILEYLLYRPQCGRNASKATFAVPDCDFDERFGFPCTEKQRSKVKKAQATAEPLEHY